MSRFVDDIREAIRDGPLLEPFRPSDVRRACPGWARATYSTFLPAHRVDNPHGYVAYCARGPFQGGCFFAAAAHEFDGRPGPVRDRVMAFFDSWGSQVRVALQEAQQKGQLRDGVDVNGFVFELFGIGFSANLNSSRPRSVHRFFVWLFTSSAYYLKTL